MGTQEAAEPASIAIDPPSDPSDPSDPSYPSDPSTPRGRGLDRRFVLAALMLVMVLASMEQTITSTSMPTIIGDLQGMEHYSWVTSIFLLASMLSMPLYGRLADTLGRKRVIIGAISLFMLGSILAAFAQSMVQLVIYRGIQGLGAGGIMPVVLTIAADIFTLRERAKIQGFFSMVWGSAALAGPALGAFLVVTLGWRSVFWVNLPLGALGLIVLMWKYHDYEKPHPADLDLPGVAALSAACVTLLGVASNLGPDGWSWSVIGILSSIALACLIFLFWHERRAAYPILSPAMLTSRVIGPAIACSCLFGLAFLSLDTYVPLYVQGGRGGGVTAAASVVTPVMLTWATSGVIAAPLLIRWGFRRTALVGGAIMLLAFSGLVICAWTGASHIVLTAVLALCGLGFGFASMSFLLAAQDAVPWHQRGAVTSTITFFRSVGGSLGVAALYALFKAVSKEKMDELHRLGVSLANPLDPHSAVRIPPELAQRAQDTIASGLTWVFIAMLCVVVVQFAVTFLMPAKCADHKISATEGMEAMG